MLNCLTVTLIAARHPTSKSSSRRKQIRSLPGTAAMKCNERCLWQRKTEGLSLSLSIEKESQAKSTIQDDTKPNIGSQIKKQGITLRANDIRQAEKRRKVKKKEKIQTGHCTVHGGCSKTSLKVPISQQWWNNSSSCLIGSCRRWSEQWKWRNGQVGKIWREASLSTNSSSSS